MSNLERKFRVILTNWINLVGVFLVVYLCAFLMSYTSTNFSILQSLFSLFILVGLYGLLFWVGFSLELILLDFLLINSKHITSKLITEWVLICTPIIYCTIKYNEWILLSGVIAFLITQFLRKKMILKAVEYR